MQRTFSGSFKFAVALANSHTCRECREFPPHVIAPKPSPKGAQIREYSAVPLGHRQLSLSLGAPKSLVSLGGDFPS